MAVTVAIVSCLGLASGVAFAGTSWISALLAKPGYGEPDCDPQRQVQRERGHRPGEPLCGSRFGDRLTASSWGNHTIRGFQGNDVIHARNGKPDEIRGHQGYDTAYVDADDDVMGVEVCKPTSACRRAQRSSNLVSRRLNEVGASDFDYPVYKSSIECRKTPGSGKNQLWFIAEPLLRAADATPRVDWQTVAWSPVLYKLENPQWVKVEEKDWLWDRTNDTAPPDPLHENWWRTFTKPKERKLVWFLPATPGTYQVRLRYYWYKTQRVPEHSWEDSADSVDPHYSSDGFESPTHKSCVFP